jgi:hypothetical protein
VDEDDVFGDNWGCMIFFVVLVVIIILILTATAVILHYHGYWYLALLVAVMLFVLVTAVLYISQRISIAVDAIILFAIFVMLGLIMYLQYGNESPTITSE